MIIGWRSTGMLAAALGPLSPVSSSPPAPCLPRSYVRPTDSCMLSRPANWCAAHASALARLTNPAPPGDGRPRTCPAAPGDAPRRGWVRVLCSGTVPGRCGVWPASGGQTRKRVCRPADGRGANCERLCRQYLQLLRDSGSTTVAHNCNTQRHCFHGSCLCVVHHPRAPGIRSLYDGDVLCGRLHGVRRHGRLCQHRTYHGVSDLGFDCGESCGNHFHRANSVAS